MFGPRREERAALAAAASYLKGVQRGLALGKKVPLLPGLSACSAPSQVVAPEGGYDGVLWRLERALGDGLPSLRPHLAPGARLFMLVELVPSVWSVTRELLGGREIVRFTREGICEEALMFGLLSPQVWVDSARFVALSAQLPAHFDALDEIFHATVAE